MVDETQRAVETAKYAEAYKQDWYAMGADRMADARADLSAIPTRGRYLDVSCGRGEMLDFARDALKFELSCGTETVLELCRRVNVIHALANKIPLPDDSFDVVSMFDVMEHLLPGDDELAVRELCRVSRGYVLIAINNHPSVTHDGVVLHVNLRPYSEWGELLREWMPNTAILTRIVDPPRRFDSATWRIEW